MNNIIAASLTKMATAVDPATHQHQSLSAHGGGDGPEMMPSPTASGAAPSYNRSPEDVVDYVTVSDPVIHADGMNKYTSYRVDCRPDPNVTQPQPGPHYSANQITDVFLQNNPGQYSSVLRRYSDFLWLYERLHKEKAGAIVPPLPEKQAVSRFSPEFVEDRRRALEKFLRRVIFHPELWEAECLLTFLRADDVAFMHAKNVTKKEAAASGDSNHSDYGMSASLGGAGAFNIAPKNTAGIKKWFSEAKTTFSGDLVTSPDDDLFDEIERYIEALAIQMKRVSNQTAGLVRKSKEIANGFFEFGLAFHQLGQSEGEELGNKLQLVGGTADRLSSLAASQAEAELRRLEEPFKDYLKIVHAVKLALGRRHDKRVSYTALLHEIQTREVNLHRLRSTPGSEAKAYSTEMSLQRYQAAAEVAREGYADVSQRVLREVDRFKREKAGEMRTVVLEFIRLEIEVHRGMEKVWGELVPQLEKAGEMRTVVLEFIRLEIEVHRSMEKVWGELVPQLEEGGGGGVDGGGGQGNVQQQQQQTHPTMASMPPPSQMPPPPAAPAMLSSQPTYSNVPSGPQPMGGMAGTGTDPMMESSVQYRDNDLPGMGL